MSTTTAPTTATAKMAAVPNGGNGRSTAVPVEEAGYARHADFDHRAGAPKGAKGLTVQRVFTTEGVHPYDEVEWERRDVVMTNWRDGVVNFEQRGVEFPAFWSLNATNIVTSKYFRGKQGTPQRETSLRQAIDRVVGTYVAAGKQWRYFATDADAEIFRAELTYMLLHQIFSFNSPVWFNVGTTSPQQVSACFLLAVNDDMPSILDWYKEEGLIFKGGSGSGANLSQLRASMELLSMGGRASGPLSFMRGADSVAGAIRSGGSTRRAAKMVILDVDHPDIEEFVNAKAREEDKIRALRDAGFDMDLDGMDSTSVQFQNANNSVRVNGEFMRAVEAGGQFALTARLDGAVVKTVDARELFHQIAQAAWACADPGIQYDDTINDWHTCPATDKIRTSNPCSEYMHLDNSSCNLASLNLMKFLKDDGTFDVERFVKATEFVITAMDISICFADFPTWKIADGSRRFRQLGIGYANLGALLMATGHAYDSEGGRGLAAAITSLLTAVSYRRSAELAGVVGPYVGYAANEEGHQRVMLKHESAAAALAKMGPPEAGALVDERTARGLAMAKLDGLSRPVAEAAVNEWRRGNDTGQQNGWRNAQASLLAPTGTIGLMMDVDTTGIEPDLALVKYKKLVGGGSMQIVNQTVPRALRSLGYQEEQVEAIVAFINEHGHVVGAPALREEHYSVFDCAMGERSIAPMGHVRMMAATQPFLSGAISKTVNMPEAATVEDVEQIYRESWRLGLKALAIYRDNCKVGQPLQDAKGAKKAAEAKAAALLPTAPATPVRKRLPKRRSGDTVSFAVAGAEGYLTANAYEDGGLGEVFLKMSKQGSTLAGMMDAFSVVVSIALQYGVPLETLVSKFVNMRFEPAGMVDRSDPDIRNATSIVDYVFRRLALDFLPFEVREQFGIYTIAERLRKEQTGSYLADEDEVAADAGTSLGEPVTAAPVAVSKPEPAAPTAGPAAHTTTELLEVLTHHAVDAPLCYTCGTKMRPAGSCYVCEGCGSTSGCS